MDNIINVKSQTELSSFYIVFHGSTQNERPGWYGLSHLIEHLAFKSSEYLMDDFSRYGVYDNAYTSDTNVVFYMQGLQEYIVKYRQEFLDNITKKFNITQKQLDIEKNIVLAEYGDTFVDQQYAHILNLYRKKYNRYTAIGLKEDIENITLDDIYDYYNKYMTKPSKLINVVKDEKLFIDNMDINEFSNNFQDEKVLFGTYDNDFEINNKFEDKESVVAITKPMTENYAISNFITTMLSNGLQSPLYQELREKRGLVYSILFRNDNLNDTQYTMYLSIQTKKGKSEEAINIIKEVFNNPKKYITKERFDVVKDLYLITFKKNEIERYQYLNKYIKQPQFVVENFINNITYDDVMNNYDKIFNLDNWYFSVDNKEFE
jgi:predicted Zn-dependent peptidase